MSMKSPFDDPNFVFAASVEVGDDGLKLLTFPDGFRCYTHSNEQEVMIMYNEIFVKKEYLGSNIALDACRYVFDVGANIGLFTIFVKMMNRDLIVHSFEPIKATYDVLVRNINLHSLKDVYPHNYALGNEDNSEHMMTFYPNAAGNATAHPESKDDLKRILAEMIGQEQTTHLFQSPQQQVVKTRTLSSILNEEDIPAIDLLKIDAEGDEMAVLHGIADDHYEIIRQIAAEVHSPTLLAEAQALLANRGFQVSSDAGIAIGNTLYAVKS